MQRRSFLQRLGFVGAAAIAPLSSVPVFGKDESGEDVISMPIILKRSEVVAAFHAGRGSLSNLLHDRAASVRPMALALACADKGWIYKQGHSSLQCIDPAPVIDSDVRTKFVPTVVWEDQPIVVWE